MLVVHRPPAQARLVDDVHLDSTSSIPASSCSVTTAGAARTGPTSDAAPKLRPFFGFYGGKWRDAIKHYPVPTHDTLVEPFAGSAGYSLRYPDKKVVLCEIDPVIAGVWEYLIRVSPSEILAIPDIPVGGGVADLKLCQEAAWLVGFWMNRGASRPRQRPSKWMREKIRPGSFWGDRVRNTISSQVEHIRHWKIYNISYANCPVTKNATWFVDPPYQTAGKYYSFNSDMLDFQHLGGWCKARSGQVIVCENDGADWLPFRELADVKTTRAGKRSKEVIWTNTICPEPQETVDVP